MGLLDIFYKKWKENEILAYLKVQIDLINIDGHADEREHEAILSNMKIIKWNLKGQSEINQKLSEAKKIAKEDYLDTIKKMDFDKKKIVSLGLKTISLADDKLMKSEEEFLKDFESKTGIPKVTFSKLELAKFKYTEKEKRVTDNKTSEKNQTKPSEFHANYQNVDMLISSLEDGGIAKDYKFVKLVFEKLKTGSVRNEEQLNNFIFSFLRKHSRDEVISKIVNFQTMENILGSALNEYEENDDTSFNGFIELEQYHSVATRAFQLCQQVMFESIISGAK